MRNIILNEGNIYRGATIEERDNFNVWEVLGKNRFQPNGWTIQSGSCKRIIFPVDMKYYII